MDRYKLSWSLLWCTALLSLSAPVMARQDLSGTWKEEYTETIVSVEQWPQACGEAPRSTGRRKRGLVFNVRDRGFDLQFRGAGSKFSTAECLSTNRAVKPKERNVKDKLFMISCSTAEDVDFYENGLYSFRIRSPTHIEYKETTRFSRNISGSLCVHTRRVRRLYRRLDKTDKAGRPNPGPKPDPSRPELALPDPPTMPAQEDACAKPGPPVSVSFEPTKAQVSRGASLCVEVSATDANGCDARVRLRWASRRRPKDIRLTPKGCLQVSGRAKLGARILTLKAGGVDTELELTVTRRVASAKRRKRARPNAPAPASPPAAAVKPKTDRTGDQVDTAQAAAEEEPDAPEPDAGQEPEPDAAKAIAAVVEPPSPTPPTAAKTPLTSTSPAKEEPGSAWLLPVLLTGGVMALLLILALVIALGRRRSKAPPDPAAKDRKPQEPTPAPTPSTPVDEFEARWGLDMAEDEPEPSPTPEPVASPEQTPQPAQPTAPEVPDPVAPSPRFCPACNNRLPEEAKFCPYCQHKLI